MILDITKFHAVAQEAKKRTNSPRWKAAIDRAVAGIASNWLIVTELYNCVVITTETGKTYYANGSCQCEAYRRNQPCRHRALARLIERYNERVN